MTNQEAYEELCDKAEKYDKLVEAIEVIKAKIYEKGKEDLSNCKDTRGSLKIACDYTMVLAIIDKHTKELMK